MKLPKLLLILLAVIFLTSFKKKCQVLIYYPDYCILISSYENGRNILSIRNEKIVEIKLLGDTIAKAQLFGCLGKSYVRLYHNKILLEESSYDSGVSDFSTTPQVYVKNGPRAPGYACLAGEYVFPKKHGQRKYYDEKGKVIKTENWRNDTLISQ